MFLNTLYSLFLYFSEKVFTEVMVLSSYDPGPGYQKFSKDRSGNLLTLEMNPFPKPFLENESD